MIGSILSYSILVWAPARSLVRLFVVIGGRVMELTAVIVGVVVVVTSDGAKLTFARIYAHSIYKEDATRRLGS